MQYGFKTNLTSGDQAALGQQRLSAATGPVAFGAQRPKPARLRHKESGVSSFCDASMFSGGMPDGWALAKTGKTPPRPSPPATDAEKSVLVWVDCGGLNYGWRIPKETLNNIPAGELTGLGIKLVSSVDKVFLGVNWIENLTNDNGIPIKKPPRARKVVAGTDGIDTHTTFYDLSIETFPTGWIPLD